MAMVWGSLAAMEPQEKSKGLGGMVWLEAYMQDVDLSHTGIRPWRNAEGLYQVLLCARGACKRAWIMQDTRTQFNTRIFHGMVVPMLAMESSRIQYMGCAMPWSSYRFIIRCKLCHPGWACVQFRGLCTYTEDL